MVVYLFNWDYKATIITRLDVSSVSVKQISDEPANRHRRIFIKSAASITGWKALSRHAEAMRDAKQIRYDANGGEERIQQPSSSKVAEL